MIELVEENPPPPKPRMSKYKDVFKVAVKEPYTWFRIDKQYKSRSAVSYLKDKYQYFPLTMLKSMRLEFRGTTVNGCVHIYVMAVEDGDE